MISITNAAKQPHITPLQDSMWHRGMAGIDSCVFNFFENFAAEVSSNNSVKIRSGIGMIQGRYFCVEPSTYDEVTIANGTQGEKRKDLIVCRWTVNEEQKVQSGDWVVIQGTPTTGTPVAPSYTAGDLDAGDLIADMPFYEVTLDGINVTGVTQKFKKLDGTGKTVPINRGGTGATTAADALAALGGVSIKKLWPNDSPTSVFKPQTIPVNLSGYDKILIISNISRWDNIVQSIMTIDTNGQKGKITTISNTTSDTSIRTNTRDVYVNSDKTGVVFDAANSKYNTITQQDNGFVIPIAIYGIKGVK